LKREEEGCISVAKGLGTWPVTAGIREKKRRKQSFPKISSRY